ncbi:hypothetical protein N9937_00675 [bacterium]|nr:hypothetical protein [bacterium]
MSHTTTATCTTPKVCAVRYDHGIDQCGACRDAEAKAVWESEAGLREAENGCQSYDHEAEAEFNRELEAGCLCPECLSCLYDARTGYCASCSHKTHDATQPTMAQHMATEKATRERPSIIDE